MQQPQSEAVTLEAQRRLELCLAAANLGIWTYNIATDEFWASDRAKHLHGHQPHEVHTFAEAGANIHPDDRDRAQAAIAQAIQTHSKLHLEYRVVWQDGSIHWIASDAEFIPSSEPGEGMFYGSVQDITERKRIEDEHQQAEEKLRESEERQSFLLKLSDALRSLADPVDIHETVTRTAMNYFGADRCYYCEIEDGNAIIRRDASREDLPSVVGVYPLSRFAILQAVIDAGHPFIVQDVHTTDTVDEALRQLCIQLQVISFVDVPVIKNGKPVGVLCLVQSTPRDWTNLEVELAVETADRTWAAVERAHTEAALCESEEKYRSLFETMDEGYLLSEVIFDENGKPIDIFYLEANPAAVRLAGRDFSGQRMREIDPNYEEYWYEIYGHVALTGESVRAERYAQPHDRWFDFYAFKVGGQESRRVAAVFNDITDRKRTEEQQAFLLKFSDALRAEPDADSVANRAVRMLAEHLHLDRVWLSEVFEQQGISTVGPEYHRPDLPPMSGVYRLSDYPETMRQLLTHSMVIHDVASDPNFSDSEKALLNQLHLRALLVASLQKGQNQVIWALAATVTTPRHWKESERVLLEQVSERTWAALERARAEAAHEEDLRATQMLHNLATRLISEEDRQALYQEIVKTAIALTQADAGSFQFLDETTQELVIMATQGIDRTMAEHFHRLDASSNTSCGIALTTGERTFINFDVPESEDPDGSLRMHKDAGLRCVQSTPLRSRSGKPIGMVSTHWCEDHQLSDRELRFLDLLARQAADIIEQRQAEENRIQLIHEQAAREQERQRAESLAELDRAKTLFFSNVSHEFRTPLTLSLVPLQDALSDRTNPLTSPHRERLELAHQNAIRLLKLVNTLLDFSRIEAGRMEAVYEPTDLARFTTELASVFRSAIERAGLRLIVDCPPLPEPVYVDREMWEKIVLNLLSNAFKFTLEGEIAVRLHPADDHYVTLQVQDTGTGIPPEELPHVFERFYQVRRTKARTYEGSGIGLALVHELIRLHGGTVDVSSTVGQGSCFTIAIPLGTAHLPSDRLRLDVGDRIIATRTLASTAIGAAPYVEEAERWLPPENAEFRPPSPPILGGTGVQGSPMLEGTGVQSSPMLEGTGVQSPPIVRETEVQSPPELGDLGGEKDLRVHGSPASPISPARVLLVDDNADMREYLTRILSEHVQVEAVADGASALAAAQERVPDLVLTDVMMPGLDGFELLKALRANPRTREVPIILLSARAGEESVVEGLEAGADDYLIKPFSAGQLVSRVKGHLQMAQLRLEALHQERTINRRKDELLSTVSHELNTPLVAILGWTRLLRANPSNQSMLMKSLETIERNATLQAKLIQDLLDISRITAGKLRLSLDPVELESVIENAIAAVLTAAIAKDIHLHWSIGHRASHEPTHQQMTEVFVLGDRDRLQQIITNLLTNAIKFTPNKGSINVELSVIEVQNSSNASYAEISITDTGIGISAEFLPHVFDRFRQAQESSSSKGLGLGLAIARHLVELHGGTIHAESAGEGQGATFVLRLPLKPVKS